jgi:hypothetical protein
MLEQSASSSVRAICATLKVMHPPPTVLPLRSEEVGMPASMQKHDFSAELSGLGYPGFAHLWARRRRNPAEVLLEALNEPNLDSRVADELPWLPMTYVDMDWDCLVRNAKVHDRQKLHGGFVVTMVYRFSRPTGELDVLEIAPSDAGRRMLESPKEGIGIFVTEDVRGFVQLQQ